MKPYPNGDTSHFCSMCNKNKSNVTPLLKAVDHCMYGNGYTVMCYFVTLYTQHWSVNTSMLLSDSQKNCTKNPKY